MVDQQKNPRQADSPLFKRLTRLFSGPIVNYRAQTPRSLRRGQLNKYDFTSASGMSFKKASYEPLSGYPMNSVMGNLSRAERYADFDQMEYMPELASAMDIYADEMTTSSELQELLRIDCPNDEIKAVLDTLYHNVLNIDHNLFGWCRTMCKFGDYFLYLDIDDKMGITNVIGLPTAEIERLEGEDKTNPNYVQYQWNSGGLTFENWQIGHFRILGNDKYAPYGTSVLEPARRIWRQLTLLEDAMMAYRIVRSPERRVFYIDVGNIAPQDIEQYMQKVMTQMKRNQVVDPTTGRIDLRYNPMSVEEDYFIPTRGNVSSKIETLAGGSYTGDIDDVKYLRDKLFSAIKIPSSYLTTAEEGGEDKTTLAQKDIRFARTIQRLQRAIITELEKIGIIHLYTLGFRQEDLISFKLYLNNPSRIAELQELEHWRTKFEIASNATEGFFSKRWVAHNIFNLSDEEYLRVQREMFHDRKIQALLDAAGEAVAADAAGGGGGDLGGDLGGEEDLGGGDDLGDDLGGDEDATGGDEDATGGDEDDVLLATPDAGADEPPAKRDDNGRSMTTTAKSNGKHYTPRISKNPAGHRKRNMKGKYAGDSIGSIRDILPGFELAKGIYEGKEANYENEEKKVFEVNNEIKKLINELESKDNEAKAQ
jgi:hypothetical protein